MTRTDIIVENNVFEPRRKFPVQAGQTETFEGTIDKYLKFETDPDEITVEVAVEVYRPWWE